jgi:hypothetical protein
MSRYLLLVLEGEMKSADINRLGVDTSVHIEDGKSRVNVNKLPRDDFEDVLQRIADSGVHRINHSFYLGDMPKHRDNAGESITAFRLAPDDTSIPANPTTDFENAFPQAPRCSRLKPNATLEVVRHPKGHMAAVGMENLVDEPLGDWLRQLNAQTVYAKVQLRQKHIPWLRILDVSAANILDKKLVLNPSVPCPLCGKPIVPLRLTLIARKGGKLDRNTFIRDATSFGHDKQEAVFLLGLDATQQLTAKYRTGYVLKPVYAADSQTAELMRQVERLLDSYLKPRRR